MKTVDRVLLGLFASIIVLLMLLIAALSYFDIGSDSTDKSDSPETDVPVETTDDQYLEVLRAEFPEFEYADDDELTSLGKRMCDTLEDVEITTESSIMLLENFYEGADGAFTRTEVGTLYGITTAAYCPEVGQQMIDSLP